MPFMYLGAKHMVTGYDHLLFLLGVVFFLYRLQASSRSAGLLQLPAAALFAPEQVKPPSPAR